MRKSTRCALMLVAVLVIAACNIPGCNTGAINEPSPLRLRVEVQNAGETFNTVGQVIRYNYIITNAGATRLAGPVIITDPQRQITCPEVNTVGNGDAYLDPNESITCTGAYSITQADLATGSVTNAAIANVGGVNSNPASVTVQLNKAPTSALTLTKTATPTSYNQIGQTITFAYVITNVGTVDLTGPFSVTDNKVTVTCTQPADGKLSPAETMNCTASYVITQADMSVGNVTNSATASGGGTAPSQPATATVINLTIITATPSGATSTPTSNLTPGATVTHIVVRGEWMLQIARCYGANYKEVRDANPTIADPDFILPGETVTVPRVGSVSRPFAPNCVTPHTVQSGDTWQSIAQKYNADVAILQHRNPGPLSVGRVVYVPNNTAGGASPPPTPQPGQPIRLTIPPGSTSVTQSGTLPPSGLARYVIYASQGQIMTVKVNAPANQVILVIYSPAGAAIKPADTTLTWSGTLPQNGDYAIDLGSNITTSNVVYTLEVSLSTAPAPPTFTPTPTATVTSTTPNVAGSFQQAADINKGPNPSRPAFLAEYNGLLYFQADGGDGAGNELWRYDGTTATRVADINNGANGSNPAYLTVYNGALYFGALSSDGAGNELWRYDGTNATRAADIWSGPEGSNPTSLAVFNGILYFSANGNDGTGIELWKYDGTSASRAADIFNGAGNSAPSSLIVYNAALHFRADGGDGAGHELWKYDGTNASRIADIWNGSGNANPSALAVYNNVLYFGANGNDGAGYELWKYDGSGVSRVADIWAGISDSTPAYLTVYNGLLYFNANDGSGQRLWRFDGTTPSRVPDSGGITISNPAFLAAYKGALYFQADGNNGSGLELWRYNATTG